MPGSEDLPELCLPFLLLPTHQLLLSLLRWVLCFSEPVSEDALSPNTRLISLLFSPHSEALDPLPNSWEGKSTGPAWTRCAHGPINY